MAYFIRIRLPQLLFPHDGHALLSRGMSLYLVTVMVGYFPKTVGGQSIHGQDYSLMVIVA